MIVLMMRHHATALHLNDAIDNFVFDNTPSRAPLVLKEGNLVHVDTAALVPTSCVMWATRSRVDLQGPSHASRRSPAVATRSTYPTRHGISHTFLKKAHKNEVPGRPAQPTIPRSALEPGTFEVETIVGHEFRKRQYYYFKVKWLTFADTECTFEPLASVVDSRNSIVAEPLRRYIKENSLSFAA